MNPLGLLQLVTATAPAPTGISIDDLLHGVGGGAELGSAGLLIAAIVYLLNKGAKLVAEQREADRKIWAEIRDHDRRQMDTYTAGMATAHDAALETSKLAQQTAISLEKTAASLERIGGHLGDAA